MTQQSLRDFLAFAVLFFDAAEPAVGRLQAMQLAYELTRLSLRLHKLNEAACNAVGGFTTRTLNMATHWKAPRKQ